MPQKSTILEGSHSLQTKRYFTNLYETVNDAAGQEKHLHYLIAPTGVFAVSS